MLWMEEQYAGSGSSVEELSRNAYANPLAASTLAGVPPLTGVVSLTLNLTPNRNRNPNPNPNRNPNPNPHPYPNPEFGRWYETSLFWKKQQEHNVEVAQM